MRKAIVSALMMTLLVLPGCGGRERTEAAFLGLRQAVTDASCVTATAEISANYGGAVSAYTVEMTYDGRETVMELTSPATVAGIRASARQGETAVAYENVVLGAGPLDPEGLSPVSALPVLMDAIASAYVELVWRDGDLDAARLYVGDSSVATVWLDPAAGAPVFGEISDQGETVISCRFTDWDIS